MPKIQINNVTREMTTAEATLVAAQQSKARADHQLEREADAARDLKQLSGKQKLKDLGLDEEEIKALTGV